MKNPILNFIVEQAEIYHPMDISVWQGPWPEFPSYSCYTIGEDEPQIIGLGAQPPLDGWLVSIAFSDKVGMDPEQKNGGTYFGWSAIPNKVKFIGGTEDMIVEWLQEVGEIGKAMRWKGCRGKSRGGIHVLGPDYRIRAHRDGDCVSFMVKPSLWMPPTSLRHKIVAEEG